jgi:osmoprotectant transport system permease protein
VKMYFSVIFFILQFSFAHADTIRIGAKNFTENYLLAELIAQTIEDETQYDVQREFGLQGTGIIYEAISSGEIDLYVEYTGTISEAILKQKHLKSIDELRAALNAQHLVMSNSIGFNNTYAIAVRRQFAKEHNLKTMSDLMRISQSARFAFTYEFMSRSDGFVSMNAFYKLGIPAQSVRSMDHALVYTAIENNQVDVIEVYSTDAKIEILDLVLLEDDKHFFPNYDAVLIAREDFVKKYPDLWNLLQNKIQISETKMRKLNAEVDVHKKSFSNVISNFLEKEDVTKENNPIASRILRRTKEHIVLVLFSLTASLLIGLPLAIMAFSWPWLAQSILLIAGVVQTIPSLALLCFLIPVFGIGQAPALVALFLYGLLPIVLNTYTGLKNLDKSYREISMALGLTTWQRLRIVELPMVTPQILSGIKTSAIIGIGTATLAALIGAGGYGAPIIIGLAINDIPTILWGAIPAAVMALCVHVIFEVINRLLIPKGLR